MSPGFSCLLDEICAIMRQTKEEGKTMPGFAIYESSFGPVRMDYEGNVLLRLRTVEPTEETGERTQLTQ